MSERRYFLESVGNALDVLSILARRGEAGVTELAGDLKLGKATAFRLLFAVQTKGFVQKNQATEKYRLGYRAFAIGTKVQDRSRLGTQITPLLEELAGRCGETVNVAVLDGDEVVHINKVVSNHALRLDFELGDREPVHSTALGKVLLASLEWNEILSRLGKGGLKRYTPNTIVTRAALEIELQRVRKQGYAVDNEEAYPGIRCVGVPIRDADKEVIAALSISAPTTRFTLEKVSSYRAFAGEIADRITQLLQSQVGAPR